MRAASSSVRRHTANTQRRTPTLDQYISRGGTGDWTGPNWSLDAVRWDDTRAAAAELGRPRLNLHRPSVRRSVSQSVSLSGGRTVGRIGRIAFFLRGSSARASPLKATAKFCILWTHSAILRDSNTGTKMRMYSVMRPRSCSRGRNTSACSYSYSYSSTWGRVRVADES